MKYQGVKNLSSIYPLSETIEGRTKVRIYTRIQEEES